MAQPWYGPHGPSSGAGHPCQTGPGTMHHHRYHNGAGMNATSYNMAQRSSPTMNHYRPSSSASTSSASSFTVASGPPHPTSHGHNSAAKHHPMPILGGSSPGHPGHGHGHHSGVPHHMSMPTARYPMPPRNGGAHMDHFGHGGHTPMRSFQGGPPPSTNQPLRQLSAGNTPNMGTSSSPSQFGPPLVKPSGPGPLGPAGNPPLHHPVPYRHHPRMHAMNGPPMNGPPGGPGPNHHYHYHHQGYHHDARRSSYQPSTPHHLMGAQQHHEVQYSHFQRPMYESPETVDTSLRGSPSPPPPPPSFSQDRESAAPTPNSLGPATKGLSECRLSGDDSMSKSKKENTAAESCETAAPPKKAAVNADDDAASILLQLSGVPSQSAGQETENNNNESRPMSTVHGVKTASFESQSQSNPGLLKPIDPSFDDDTTIATADYAPDLTSEPSSDSIDHNDSEFPAWIPENYPTRLAIKYDDTKLNSLHCFLRSELLEIFVVQKSSHKSPTHSPGSSVGRVGLRCVHCAMHKHRDNRDRDEAPMAVFYPKSIAEIYRLVTSWQRCHLRKCRNLPPAVRSKWMSLRESDKSRGKTHYWITSAKEIGLIDCQSRAGGIRFGPHTNKGSEAATTKLSPQKAVDTETAPNSKSSSEQKVTAPTVSEQRLAENTTDEAKPATAVV